MPTAALSTQSQTMAVCERRKNKVYPGDLKAMCLWNTKIIYITTNTRQVNLTLSTSGSIEPEYTYKTPSVFKYACLN